MSFAAAAGEKLPSTGIARNKQNKQVPAKVEPKPEPKVEAEVQVEEAPKEPDVLKEKREAEERKKAESAQVRPFAERTGVRKERRLPSLVQPL
jgi:hypothetical protein